jgi:hypothetical protein
MANFTETVIDNVWQEANEVKGDNGNEFRQDCAGARIQKDKYGQEGDYGWEIDHILPQSLGSTDRIENLLPLQWENNQSKADDFPHFKTVISSDGKNLIKKEHSNALMIDYFKDLYPDNQYLKQLKAK